MAISPRASNDEREQVVDELKRAYAEGRLEDTELDVRVGLALTATTRQELEPLLADLPAEVAWTATAAARTPGATDGVLVAPAKARGRARCAEVAASDQQCGRPPAHPVPSLGHTALNLLLVAVGTGVLAYVLAALISAAMSVHLVN